MKLYLSITSKYSYKNKKTNLPTKQCNLAILQLRQKKIVYL